MISCTPLAWPFSARLQVLLGTALGGICYKGGIVDDDSEERPEVTAGGEEAAAAASGGSAVA
jgi:hypothetical protein